MTADDGWNAQRWRIAIAAADTWRNPSTPKAPGPKKVSDLKPLAELIRSGASLPQSIREDLADLLTRHRLTLIAKYSKKTPSYQVAESEVNARTLDEFVEEYRRQPAVRYGPYNKIELEHARKVMQDRAKAKGRGRIEVDRKAAAKDLREKQLHAFCDYYGLNCKEFENALYRKSGTINRLNKKRL